ncbi:MAG: rhodanese-like domain-containing protein [Planctomycetota bacterium]
MPGESILQGDVLIALANSTALLLAVIASSQCVAEEYVRPELLVEPSELWAWFNNDVPHVLINVHADDASGTALLRARSINIGDWRRAFGDGTDEAAWTERLQSLVPSATVPVVVYDHGLTPNAARAWWVLKYWGLEDVRLLNGGLKAWRASGLPVESVHFEYQDSTFVATANPERLATRAEVLGIVDGGETAACLVDTRSPAEVIWGIIPSAKHSNWVHYVDPATGKMRSADELAVLLDEVGFEVDQSAVAYCRSGGRASVVAFAMELMGGRRVANYFSSWNDWRSDPSAPVGPVSVQQLPAETKP